MSFSRSSFKGFSWSRIWEILELSELLFHSAAKALGWQLLGQLTALNSRLGMPVVWENQGLLAGQQGLF